MSAPKIEIVNPIRFFSFFGLFLIFLFLAFRSCSDTKETTKYVDAKKVTETEAANLKKANSEELSDFITDIKKDLEKSDSAKDEKLSEDQLAKKEANQKRAAKEKAEFNRNRDAANKRAAEAKNKAAAKAKAKKAVVAKVSKKNIIVKSQSGRLSPFSKLQLKQAVTGSSKPFSKIMIYGYYGTGQAKGKAFVKAAEIKNTLIGLGVKRSVPIYMLTEQTRLPDAMGKVIFSQ